MVKSLSRKEKMATIFTWLIKAVWHVLSEETGQNTKHWSILTIRVGLLVIYLLCITRQGPQLAERQLSPDYMHCHAKYVPQ